MLANQNETHDEMKEIKLLPADELMLPTFPPECTKTVKYIRGTAPPQAYEWHKFCTSTILKAIFIWSRPLAPQQKLLVRSVRNNTCCDSSKIVNTCTSQS